jgi:hypothetical protein
MYNISLLSAIFQGIPESVALAFLALVLLKVRLDWKVIFIIGIIHTCAAYIIRMLPFAFGVHTVLLVLTLSFVVMFFTKKDIIEVVPMVLIVFILLITYEFVAFSLITNMLNVSFEMLFENEFIRIFIGFPQTLLLFLTGLIVLYIRKQRR